MILCPGTPSIMPSDLWTSHPRLNRYQNSWLCAYLQSLQGKGIFPTEYECQKAVRYILRAPCRSYGRESDNNAAISTNTITKRWTAQWLKNNPIYNTPHGPKRGLAVRIKRLTSSERAAMLEECKLKLTMVVQNMTGRGASAATTCASLSAPTEFDATSSTTSSAKHQDSIWFIDLTCDESSSSFVKISSVQKYLNAKSLGVEMEEPALISQSHDSTTTAISIPDTRVLAIASHVVHG
jgi:hypothetical protein